MGNEILMIERRFERLKVVQKSERRKHDHGGYAYWDCVCDCGNLYPHARGDSLRSGKLKSCGCLRKEKAKSRMGGRVKGKPHKYPAVRSNTPMHLRNIGQHTDGN